MSCNLIQRPSVFKGAVGLALITVLVIGITAVIRKSTLAHRFNRIEWVSKAISTDGTLKRGLMVQDVLNNVLRVGMKLNRVTDVLGKPDSVSSADSRTGDKGLVYDTGTLVLGVCPERLYITVGKDNAVKDFAAYCD